MVCSIMGYCSEAADYAQLKSGFDRTISRGPDDSRIVDTGNGLLGFHRLAIMGLQPEGMQPFALDGSYVVCNGEIYGFETLEAGASGERAIRSKAGLTVRSCSRCIGNTAWRCFPDAGCGVCVDLIRRRYQKLYRRPGPPSVSVRSTTVYGPSGTIVFASGAQNLVGLL